MILRLLSIPGEEASGGAGLSGDQSVGSGGDRSVASGEQSVTASLCSLLSNYPDSEEVSGYYYFSTF
jgi:hypothetical protein